MPTPSEEMRDIQNRLTEYPGQVKYVIVVVDDQGNEVDTSEAYEGTNYMFMSAQNMLPHKKGWKLEIRLV